MRIAHLADIHSDGERFAECKASIDAVITEHKREAFDLIVLAGDTWDGAVQNSARALFDSFLDLIRQLADCAPVVMIYGTPSHDTEGSLEVFERIQALHDIRILRPGKAYFLEDGVIFGKRAPGSNPQAVLFGVPEPQKKWLLANGGATGKDASDEAVRGAMRSLLLGLGGMRKEHIDLPCLLLYHGQVSGAKTGTGYSASSGIAVSIDDLRAVGADYYALGDIHEPQKVGDIEAYYPGSIYPKDFGETHKAGCNIVEIKKATVPVYDLFQEAPVGEAGGGYTVEVSRLDFPHPQRIHEIVTLEEFDNTNWSNKVGGKVAWIEIKDTRDACSGLDTEYMSANLTREEYGALPGSRVTLNILPTETVRAGEIAEKKTLEEKVVVWGENSSVEIPEGVKQKARDLEREAEARGAAVSGAHIRITRLVLRGAIGIWKNQRKDEIDLNLDEYGPGVIAMIGTNGAGKTTILENLHAWPWLLTRDGALKDHFRLKDSFRDLYFTDERTGVKYRALIQIRADIASGGIECFLYRDTGFGYEALPGINGRQDPYIEAVTALFGSFELYQRTAFQSQKPTPTAPDLSETTKGQRKALFAELSGVDYLQGYARTAKEKADALEGELVRLRAQIDAAADVDGTIERLRGEIERAEKEAVTEEKRSGELRARGIALKAEGDKLAEKIRDLEGKLSRKAEIERQIADLQAESGKARAEIEGFKEAGSHRAAAEAELKRMLSLEEEAGKLRGEKTLVDQKNHEALVAHQKAVEVVMVKRREAQDVVDQARSRKSAIEQAIAVARVQLSKPIADHCPTCAQLLPEEKRAHLKAEREKVEAEISRKETELTVAVEALTAAESVLSQTGTPEAPKPIPFPGADRLTELEGELSFLDPEEERVIIRKADEAAVRIEAAAARIKEASAKESTLSIELASLSTIPAEYAEASEEGHRRDAEIDGVRESLQTVNSSVSALRSSAKAYSDSLAEAEKRAKAREAAREAVGGQETELAEWRLLEKATGPDGIQALELDALAPSIAAVTNRLLSEYESGRYSVEFRTTRIAGKGSKTKQIETFEIYILDSQSGIEQEIGTLSGGEGVWVKRAIYDAFAAIRAQNMGVKFLTICQDETDGALNPAARMDYLRMLEAAHGESGRYQTLLITHSPEIQAMVTQSIDVWKLEGRKAEEKAA